MSKGQQFWRTLWNEGRLPFHKDEVNEDLVRFFPLLNMPPNSRVLVPLCGKSVDMLWLVQQGYQVIGIELVEKAVHEFAAEHSIDFKQERLGHTTRYFTDNLDVLVADIFTMDKSLIAPVDGIYDRGALVALPGQLRPNYADICMSWLKPNASILLKTLEYDQRLMEGPPYSVSSEEVKQLYRGSTHIGLLKNQVRDPLSTDHLFQRGVQNVRDFVWLIGQFNIAL
ncbi:thiopurine S-methyltransferase [Legionella waltersii]|uniref:Thiopurine S-methyltransferase n=1 Tax=Legionella waltersii TaxID=66969 RepID=A0A0W1A5Q1_9GAMM|nr:thiopurine S-methyltransferase [Legionella waltersii]KTD76339.1 thiopurine S-methyltransferase [Legionella waltersii]SNV13821.1 thiopurine S-methyltransferase [Legionella waltersii]